MTDPDGRPIVAELGRAETAEETWERKQNARVARRQHQTTINLVLSLVASLAIVLALVAVVVRPSTNTAEQNNRVNYVQVAAQAAIPGTTLAAPKLPSTYWSNRADYASGTADGVDVWTVGLITPDNQYIGIHQGIKANPTWVSEQLDQQAETGTRTIDGTKWDVYDRRAEGSSAGNLEYSLVSTFGSNTIVLAGTADNRSFDQVATAITKQFDK